jgi:hypothetical protein
MPCQRRSGCEYRHPTSPGTTIAGRLSGAKSQVKTAKAQAMDTSRRAGMMRVVGWAFAGVLSWWRRAVALAWAASRKSRATSQTRHARQAPPLRAISLPRHLAERSTLTVPGFQAPPRATPARPTPAGSPAYRPSNPAFAPRLAGLCPACGSVPNGAARTSRTASSPASWTP